MNWMFYILFIGITQFVFAQDSPFEHNQSSVQGFYFFESVTIDGESIDDEDWVGAFNGDVCVGTRQWNTSSLRF